MGRADQLDWADKIAGEITEYGEVHSRIAIALRKARQEGREEGRREGMEEAARISYHHDTAQAIRACIDKDKT